MALMRNDFCVTLVTPLVECSIVRTPILSCSLMLASCLYAAIASAATPTFDITALTTSPTAAFTGGQVTFSTTVTSNETVSQYTIGLQVFLNGVLVQTANKLITGLNFSANHPLSTSAIWNVPVDASSGTYSVLASVFDPRWNWLAGKSMSFHVSSLLANGTCGSSNDIILKYKPVSGLCAAGNASSVSGIGPWAWTCAGSGGGSTAQCLANIYEPAAELPGPSAALSATPPYTCVTNTYVSATTGNDENDGSEAHPWKTLAEASTYPHHPVAGECINVLPGTYVLTSTLILSSGGNANSPTGNVVYRSTTPQAAHLIAGDGIDNGANGDMVMVWSPYIVLDGFHIDGNATLAGGSGIDACAGGGGPYDIAHHLTAINNIIHGVGGAGISTCSADFITIEHNLVYNTSHVDKWQVSGIDLFAPRSLAAASYTPTPADKVTYGIVIGYNIAHDNIEGAQIVPNQGCTPVPPATKGPPCLHTDGNGIIVDTTLNSNTCPTCGAAYGGQILVVGNVAYNNGGRGVHVFLSKNVTVANNTVYNNMLDLYNSSTLRGELSNGGSQNITWRNNLAFSMPGTGLLAVNRPVVNWTVNFGGTASTAFPDTGSWSHNLMYGGPVSSDAGNAISSALNMIGINPLLANPASGNLVPLSTSPVTGTGVAEHYLSTPTPDIGAY